MSEVNTRSVLARFRGNNWEQGMDFIKLSCQKTCVGDGVELERALDDAFASKITLRSCCIRPSCRKIFRIVLCLFDFVEAKKFRNSSEYSDCVQNV